MELSPFLLCLIGLILLLIEVFIVPGFGVVGIAGLSLLLWGAYRYSEEHSLWWGLGAFALCIGVVILSFIVFFRSPASKWIVHRDAFSKLKAEEKLKLGQRGRSTTPLYPSGKAYFAFDGREKLIDVSSSGEFIESNQEIEIFMIEGNRIFVKSVNGKVS